MKYVIVYLIKGKAKRYQIALINELSKEFGLENLNDHIMPHLTLKYSSRQLLNKNRLGELEKIIRDFTKTNKPFKFGLSGFGNFNKEVLFIRTSNKNLNKFYSEFIHELDKLKWIKLGKYEKENRELHATIAYVKNKKKFIEIQKYLSNRHPNYNLKFDNIAILKKPEDKWIIHKKFKIK